MNDFELFYNLQQDCLARNELVDIEYYHRTITLEKDAKILQGLMIVLSTYDSFEREYLQYLAKSLGAEVNDCYERKQNPILVCPKPDGKKYNAAIEWSKSEIFIFYFVPSL